MFIFGLKYAKKQTIKYFDNIKSKKSKMPKNRKK